MHTFKRIVTLLFLITASAHGAAVFPLPPFTVYGIVRDWNGRPFSSSDAATVIVKVQGVELARCEAKSGSYPTLTYRAEIPMASGPMAGRAQAGAPITFEVFFDGQIHTVAADQAPVVVGNPAASLCCSLVVGTFSYGDDLPDEYKQLLLAYYQMAGQGDDLASISADDDFDGDGYSNFQEFQAGTIPVLGDDYLKIIRFSLLGYQYPTITFLTAPDRTYRLPNSSNLNSNAWDYPALGLTTNAASAQSFYTSPQDATTTLYLQPTTNSSAFYRLEVE